MANCDSHDGAQRNTPSAQPQALLFKEECYGIQGAIFDVYREMGSGFLEPVYQECLERELAQRAVPYVPHSELILIYKGEPLQQTYRPDFICHQQIIVELKAVKQLLPEHQAQLFNYLKATGMELGMLVNFGAHPKVEIQRIANSYHRGGRK